MHKESLYLFILYVLLHEGKSNLPFKLEAMLLGKRHAVRHFFFRLFKGCDVPSFLNLKELFEKDYPQCSFIITDDDIVTDDKGLMSGMLKD